MDDRYDVVIVGSGFGGAVMAARLGQHVRDALGGRFSILVVEKGDDPTGRFDPSSAGAPIVDGTRNRQSLDPEYLAGVGELFTDTSGAYRAGAPSMTVVAGKGIGGGSNLYLGVSLRAPSAVFELARDDRRLWPTYYDRASLDRHYATVESELSVHRMRWTDDDVPHWQLTTKRDFVFAEGCRRIGATALPLKLADANDANEGWWAQGQRFEGRQDLTKNYLQDALETGVEFASGCPVDRVAPTPDGYVLFGRDRRGGAERDFELECRVLIVASGCVGSTGLLLRSREAFAGDRALSERLGAQLSSNGDYGVTGIVGADYPLDVEGHKGKPMSSFCPSFWPEHRFLLIPFYASPIYLALSQFTSLLPPELPDARGRGSTGPKISPDGSAVPDWGEGYMERLSLFGSRMLTMGCLALDESEGRIELGRDGRTPEVRWPDTHPATEARWSAAVDAMHGIYRALGGEMFLDTYRRAGTVSTSHPLGGCPMADDREHGVVASDGEVFGNPSLFVIDGAIVPAALGVNPSLTIAAVAESIAERLTLGQGTRSIAERLA